MIDQRGGLGLLLGDLLIGETFYLGFGFLFGLGEFLDLLGVGIVQPLDGLSQLVGGGVIGKSQFQCDFFHWFDGVKFMDKTHGRSLVVG